MKRIAKMNLPNQMQELPQVLVLDHGLTNGIVTNGMFVSSLDVCVLLPEMGPWRKQLRKNRKLKVGTLIQNHYRKRRVL